MYGRLIDAYLRSGRPVIVATFDGAPRNPVLLARAQWRLSDRIDDVGSIADVDTPADLLP